MPEAGLSPVALTKESMVVLSAGLGEPCWETTPENHPEQHLESRALGWRAAEGGELAGLTMGSLAGA